MPRVVTWMVTAVLVLPSLAFAAEAGNHDANKNQTQHAKAPFKVLQKETRGSVRVEGNKIEYKAIAGTLIVHPKGWDDVPANDKSTKGKQPSVASMFYVAYFKVGEKAGNRPITFLYNGGPGSPTMWLHMGAFGPRRVLTSDDKHTPPAPYRVVNNDFSLLDASDLVFIDAPGTGFSRIAGTNRVKDFYGVDEDGHAFASFIEQFLSKYGRWNSPKYLFGESYGTTRNAVLVNLLQRDDIDLNGVIMLSQILNFDLRVDYPQVNPGVDLPYELSLPTYAATAWYHKKLPNAPTDLTAFLKEVETFAMGDYAAALSQGSLLSDSARQAIAEKLHDYIGLPVAYILKANLRINGGQFEKTLLADEDATTGRLDTRFSGPTLNPLSEGAEYDPQASAISSAYYAAINEYLRKDLDFGAGETYKRSIGAYGKWNFHHKPGGSYFAPNIATNVMPDLADAMKHNPNLKVMLNAGYFDLATPFYEGLYEMHHLQIPRKLQSNIEYRFYKSGHMVYVRSASLKLLHDNVASFIEETSTAQ